LRQRDYREFFKAGRVWLLRHLMGYTHVSQVFKAYWTQSAGQTPRSNNPFLSKPSFGEVIRFVVLRPHKRHSICLYVHQTPGDIFQFLTCCRAIQTYQNQGTTARHIRARDHVVIYSSAVSPRLVDGEDEAILSRPAIKVRLDPKGEALLPTSRLNLAKLYTVEHNIPTFPVGRISSRDVGRTKEYCVQVQGLFTSSAAAPQGLAEIDEDDDEEEEDEEEEEEEEEEE
jgi:hypothetical protein